MGEAPKSVPDDDERSVLWDDGELVFSRDCRPDDRGVAQDVLVLAPAGDDSTPASAARQQHEYELRTHLEGDWALRPIGLVQERGRTVLLFEPSAGLPLEGLLGTPLDVGVFLRTAITIAAAVARMHRRGLIHKDLKPRHVLVDHATGGVRLTGFGLASRLQRERHIGASPELVAGTLAYMAPEQTGRLNRSVDSRSDLYSLGVVFYQMVTGTLPFTASDPMEWVHCHIARKAPPPSERAPWIPAVLSAVVMKLLAKAAEDRYQTAAGLERDLQRCHTQWEAQRRIDDFALAEDDVPDRLLLPEKLYGRDAQIDVLLGAFARVVDRGAPELILVAGAPGVGKSSVVNELHRVLVPSRALYAAGKFDQYKRDIPYATLAQAFRGLVRWLVTKSEDELGAWRQSLREALGPNGQLIIDMVPELKLVIGEQAQVPTLPPLDGQRRFQLVFQRFLSVFARADHPLALFLDDLQWLDRSTLDLLQNLLAQPDLRHVLFIGAYRQNEVGPTHPLRRAIQVIQTTSIPVHEVVLGSLGREDVARLAADALHLRPDRIGALANLLAEKTDGNPFFVGQLLTLLVEQGMVAFDHGRATWSWNLDRIRAHGYTDNVVALMVEKLRRLPGEAGRAVQHLACLGNGAASSLFASIHGSSEAELQAVLGEALASGLVLKSDDAYRFCHDRVQEAAYSLVPEEARATVHLRIGRTMLSQTSPEAVPEQIFQITNQLNRAVPLLADASDRAELAQLNLVAGKRAKASAAYGSALSYFAVGGDLLAEADWGDRYRLAFDLAFHRAQCEHVTGEFAAAEQRLTALAGRASSIVDKGEVACLQVDLYTTRDEPAHAMEVGLEFLRSVGIGWSPHPSDEEIREEFERIARNLGDRTIEELLELPPMTDPVGRVTLDVLISLETPAHFVDHNLVPLIIGRVANLSVERGNAAASCFGYVYLGIILESRFGDYARGLRFGRLGVALVDRDGPDRLRARVHNNFAMGINPWANHVRTSVQMLRRANAATRESGDVTFTGFSFTNLISARLVAGEPLADVQAEAEVALLSMERARFGMAVDMLRPQLALIRALRGLTPGVASFDNPDFDRRTFEEHIEDPELTMPACWYWVRRAQACYLAGDQKAALAAARQAEALRWISPAFIVMADHHFYASLAFVAELEQALTAERPAIVTQMETHRKMLTQWARTCPDTFSNRSALVEAEIARVEGRVLEAMDLYEHAARTARVHGFVQNEALASELAARFYRKRGLERISDALLKDAWRGYRRWGADGKLRQLKAEYPHLRWEAPSTQPTSTIATPVEHLDLATVVKVSQAIAGEVVSERLIDSLMRTAIEHAGAGRAVLVLSQGDEHRIAAEALTETDTVAVRLLDQPMTASMLPEAVCRFALHAQESVILEDAAAAGPFVADPYVHRRRTRSVLCLPISNQGRTIGALYLENDLAPGIFVAARIAIPKLLASQAAISLENTRLYRDLAEREAKIRRLVDANIIGIFIFEDEGSILEANDAFLSMIGYQREDVATRQLAWTALTPPEWLERDQGQHLRALKQKGSLQPFEKEYLRKDGTRVPVLLGAARFEGTSQGVAYVLDLTERKRAQEALSRAHAELARVSRVSAMSALTGSVAHEVSQPLSAVLNNATASLRMIQAASPNLEGACEAIRRLIRDGKRAAEVIHRVRALFSRRDFTLEQVDLNELTREVVGLSADELQKHQVVVHADLEEALPIITGDRVQLQQVILNLVRNASEAMADVQDRSRELRIRTELEGGQHVRLTVRDAGVGLPTQEPDALFEAFYTTKNNGMGIGLFVSRSIVERHEGRLSAQRND
ncbi:MAG: AAA family ATPase, partial [Polyangiaceae bacterium]